jgi:hypothetical protein
VKTRIAQPLLGALDLWIAHQPQPKLTRPEAIRRLLTIALPARKLPKGRK